MFHLTGATLEGNEGLSYGGGMYLNASHAELTNSTVQNNTTPDEGGCVLIYYTSFVSDNTTFVNNSPHDISIFYYISYYDDDGMWIDTHYIEQDWDINASF